MVTTFECNGPNIQLASTFANMSAASAVLPEGAYTTFRTYAGNRVLRLNQHVRRLEESMALIGQPGQLDAAAVRASVREALQTARAQADWAAPEARFRLTFAPPRLYISIEPFTPYPASLYAEGVTCVTVSLQRDNPHAKSTAFIASAAHAYKQLPTGAHEGLMIGEDGTVLEGLSSNFFAILPSPVGREAGGEGSILHTEEARVLMGVTRSLVLEVAQPVLTISTQAIALAELPGISECFITSVSREILPVVQIDDVPIGNARPGPITQTLMQRFAELVHREARPV